MKQYTSLSPSLYSYLAREFLIAFFVSFSFFFCIYFINQLLVLADEILEKDIPLDDVARLIFFSLPTIISFSLPFATLVGTLMATGRISSENEIIAMRASGFPIMQIFFPFFFLTILISISSFVINDYFLPLGTLKFGKLYQELLYKNPSLELEPYSVKRYQDNLLITGEVKSGQLNNFVIIDRDGGNKKRIITANTAELLQDGALDTIALKLTDVVSHSADEIGEQEYSSAEKLRYNILLQDITVSLRTPGAREMSAKDVRFSIGEKEKAYEPIFQEWKQDIAVALSQIGLASLDNVFPELSASQTLIDLLDFTGNLQVRPPPDQSLRLFRLEYHKKFSLPLASIAFVFVAFPIGLFHSRSSRGISFGMGLFLVTVYWFMLVGGQSIGSQKHNIHPALAMWTPNVLFLITGIVFFIQKAKH